ncbi:class II histone deacetylase [Rhodophyticola porphyridii]|uniref:Class II histone deacetylase n=1 Tax=Rhodophyticola porphyridii TaxID=1852017 RepID=A0A3L9Y933_9RHOB|nr:class II histone deacetylase [Rhodophyticola porphyridii]RMA44045.1 class II histone deacetylase [Rhodophyticola porphyridii]
MATGFFWDERCFWHTGGNYAFMSPVGGLVQPMATGGLPEDPETKRRLKNLLDVTGLLAELDVASAPPIPEEDLLRVHPARYLESFRKTSETGGGELGLRTPFGPDGYEIARLSAGLAKAALFATLRGEVDNAYALSRPPGHHCLPDFPNGFCLLANIGIAVEAAFAAGMVDRVAIVDWDVHHGNGTEAIFYDRDDVLTISIHQERNYPLDSGDFEDRGSAAGEGFNLNIPLPPGGGHRAYIEAMERLVVPQLHGFQPDAIVVACGFDASGVDPLSRMLAGSHTFRQMTEITREAAEELCDGRLTLVHEGGYSAAHVPFCGHAVLEALSGSAITAPDPLAARIEGQQPGPRFDAYCATLIAEMEDALNL